VLIFYKGRFRGFMSKSLQASISRSIFSTRTKSKTQWSLKSKVLPLSINQIKDPSIGVLAAISPRAGAAFGLPLAIQALQTSIGVQWDLIKISFSWTGKDNVDEKCEPATGSGALAFAHGILVEIGSGFSASFNLFGIILSTDILGKSVSPWGGLTYFKRTLYERCFQCGGEGNIEMPKDL